MKYLLIGICFSLLLACGARETNDPEDNFVTSLPLTVAHPANNPTSVAKVELGRMLFWDPILSGNQDVACVTCHHPSFGYADKLDISIGVGGQGLATQRRFGVFAIRNSPTILNTAFNGINIDGQYDPENAQMFWDNRATSLEEQAIGPIQSKEEMRGVNFTEAEILVEVVRRLENIPEYLTLFTEAFGDSSINSTKIAQAIASFERTLVNNNTRFDRYSRGEIGALSPEEINGLAVFMDSGCANCHSGSMFSDFELHQLPVQRNAKRPTDNGVGGRFRTPSLRNLAFTAPYMHNGTRPTLRSAIDFYDNIENPGNDPDLENVNLEGGQEAISAIATFLLTLSDSDFDSRIPDSVPSGLNPGGDI